MTKTKVLLIAFLLGAASAYAVTHWRDNARIVALQQHADSVARARHAADSTTLAYADSLARRIDSLQRAKRPVTVKITADSATAARADSALAVAATAADSVVALLAANVALTSEVAGLRTNARTDSLTLWQAMARGDSLEKALRDDGKAIADLNTRIQALNHHAAPAWLRIGFAVVKDVLAAKGAVDVVRGR